MRKTFDRAAFEEAVSDLRFQAAESLVARADPAEATVLRAQVEEARDTALQKAQDRYQRIVELGAEGEDEAVAALEEDPETARLLALLPASTRRHAEAYLGAAARWRAGRVRTNERRLAEARKALDAFDLELARGLVRRIDGRFLDEAATEELDVLTLDIERRRMELQSLQETEQRISGSGSDEEDRRPWWRRWMG